MTNPVKLYVYDLSNGLAQRLSQQLTGRQIDGVWHTSVVVFGKEIYYGQGIDIVAPGRSHHGTPLQVIDMGETSLDEETFRDYLTEMREHYTADKYHLLDFNCNSFTNDCIGFLTGGTIPPFIRDLPSDFLSTPFGAALRPTIDSMFRRPAVGNTRTPAQPSATQVDSILQSVASRATTSNQSYLPTPAPSAPSTPIPSTSVAGPIHMTTNPASMNALLRTHRAVVAFFTSATCGPCKMIEPVFERLAEDRTQGRGSGAVAFAKVDMGVGMGGSVASEWGVRVTPSFIFFLDGKKVHELKGVDASELRTQVNLLLFQAFPPHPHTTLSLPAVQALSLNPILFTQVPSLDTVLTKFTTFVSASSLPTQSQGQIKEKLTQSVLPYLKSRFTPANKSSPLPSAIPAMLSSWSAITHTLADALTAAELFPLVDMWRLALLDPAVGAWCAVVTPGTPDPVMVLLAKALLEPDITPRSYLLTLLRLLSNTFATPALASRLLSDAPLQGELLSSRSRLTALLVPTLLHQDAAVRTAAASLAFNVSALFQKRRVEKVRNELGISLDGEEDGDWGVEMVSAIMEAIDREKGSEEVVHRLTASLAFLLRLSPFYEGLLMPLLQVLQSRAVLTGKLAKGGCGEGGVGKKDIRRLVAEVAENLCP